SQHPRRREREAADQAPQIAVDHQAPPPAARDSQRSRAGVRRGVGPHPRHRRRQETELGPGMGDVWLPLLDFSVPFRGLLAVSTLTLATLIILQVLLVAPPWSRRIVGPVLLLVLSLILGVVYSLSVTEADFRRHVSEVALLLVWLGIARCGFILLFHG